MKNRTDVAIGVTTLFLCCIGTYELYSIGGADSTTGHLGPDSFPKVILTLLFLLGCAQIWQGVFHHSHKHYWPDAATGKKITLFLLWFILYCGLVITLGAWFSTFDNFYLQHNAAFSLSTFIFLTGALPLCGRRRVLEILLVSVTVPAAIVLSFSGFFQINLP